MALLQNWFVGDDEPACEPTDRELDEADALADELAALAAEADDWRARQDEGTP